MYIIRKAVSSDVAQIFNLINPYSKSGIILFRSMNDIINSLQKFRVAVLSDIVIGTISYFDYGVDLKEIRSLAVSSDYKKKGIGSELVAEIVREFSKSSSVKIFALTYTPDFFKKNRFVEVDKNTLPEKIWKDCNSCKNKDNCTETAVVFNSK